LGDVGVGWPAKVHESRLQDRFVGRNTRVNAITGMVCGPRVSRWRCSSSPRNDSRRHKKAVYVLICDRRTLSVRCDAETLFWGESLPKFTTSGYVRHLPQGRRAAAMSSKVMVVGGWVGGALVATTAATVRELASVTSSNRHRRVRLGRLVRARVCWERQWWAFVSHWFFERKCVAWPSPHWLV
jgi:hypothetical protein